MKNLIQAVSQHLESGRPCVMATVVDSSGSTPRSSGAKMAVLPDGSIRGTVGGGIVEAKACRTAAGMMQADEGTARFDEMNLTSTLAAGTDMICGGSLTLLLEAITPSSSGAQAYVQLEELMRKGRKAVLFTYFTGADEAFTAVAHAVVESPGELPPAFPLDKDVVTSLFSQSLRMGSAVQDAESGRVFAEAFVPPTPLYLFGAGHVSQATAKVAATVGFRVVVVDDRSDFANRERFPDASEICVADSFDRAFENQPVDDGAFVVIFTRGHAHDRTVLDQALKTPAQYVGMIGSKKKRDQIYDALREEGVTDESIARCHSPIGIKIGAQTPAEIAVSIVAELIAVRAGKQA